MCVRVCACVRACVRVCVCTHVGAAHGKYVFIICVCVTEREKDRETETETETEKQEQKQKQKQRDFLRVFALPVLFAQDEHPRHGNNPPCIPNVCFPLRLPTEVFLCVCEFLLHVVCSTLMPCALLR